ncbi:Crp/FNR family transcriptional regulator [Caballeronia cordobensis]|uniref:Crp/FNR family transcriptional regulator n=1 Tax=Caballeronia cordobensis TaxID=1353886 RepID=A0A158J810_CABCO|nr:helix-turn-helix domain-containing protein [Caballeronia cordobensis]SAL65004.1 Crp/FNR family transcriptional regulator [Caballeronia cordobensis]
MYASNERLPLPPVATRRTAPRCSTCSRRFLCMPAELSAREFAQVDDIVGATRAIRRGGRLFSANDRFENVYKVRTGSLKTVLVHRDGVEQINSFFVAGETLGLDGLSVDRHACDAIALEDSSVCVIPFAELERMCLSIRAMQRHLHRAMSGEIVRESALVMLLGTMSAEQRVAAFLLNLSDRVGGRGYPREELELRMTREEIGSYLGLKLETVSRMLSKFARDGLIQARAKKVRIVDREGLEKV